MEAVMAATEEQLVAIHEIGDKMASSLVEYFANEDACAVITRLAETGRQYDV